MHKDRKLRIAIDCRIEDARQGIGTAVIALAKALSESRNVGQEYTFILREGMHDWLSPYVYGPCRSVRVPLSSLQKAKKNFRWITPLRYLWQKAGGGIGQVPLSDGYVEAQGFDLVHFPTQLAYIAGIPSIYQPWDLQHLHYPEYFSKRDFDLRELRYRSFCDQATYVCVQSDWTRGDVVKQYGIPLDKVVVIPWGSVFGAYEAPSAEASLAATEKHRLPSQFFFYPAVTWPHKNHEIILRALHILKNSHGSRTDVYFTGSATARRSTLEQLARELGISDQVHFLGFLSPGELQAVFSSATAMVFPSKFEGFGLPILEAFHARVPVICSNATTLPEVGGDAVLYFDPDDPAELALLMKRILITPELRADLIGKGSLVLQQHGMDKTVAAFQALYERIAAISHKEPRSHQ